MVSFGIAGQGLGVVLAVVGRGRSKGNRSMSLAIANAAGSLGQIIGPPLTEALLNLMDWQVVFLYFAIAVMATTIFLPIMRSPHAAPSATTDQGMLGILFQALRDPSSILLFIGFFSCGYQLGFIALHFPALITEMCRPILLTGNRFVMGITNTLNLGVAAISQIALTNILGTLLAGWLGDRYRRKYLPEAIYSGRTVIFIAFILTPITHETVLLFSAFMGALWLATIPLTSGLIAYLYGLHFMGTLYGMVFLSHQIRSFIGILLGGRMYDKKYCGLVGRGQR